MASFFDRLKGLVGKNSQQTNAAFNRAIYNFLGETLVTSAENDNTYIDKGYRFNSTVYAIINLITKAASTVPFQVYEVQNSNELKRYKALTSGSFNGNSQYKAQISLKNALVELQDTELHELLDRPNPAQSYASFITELIAFGKLTGNRYIYGIGPDTGANASKYGELYVLPSQAIEIHSGGLMRPVNFYTMEYNGTYRMEADDVCHIKDFNPDYDGSGQSMYGMSPLKAGLRSMDANNEALTTGVRYLQNQTARGVLMSEEGDLNEVQARQLKEKFKQQYQGSNNAGDVIITPKKLSWVNFGLNASDLSLIEQYNTTIKDLCNIYNIPAVLLNNVESATYNNVKEARKMMYTNAVIPELLKIRDELNRWLAPKFGDKLFIDFDTSVIPELQEETEKVVNQMTAAWWLTPNEKRQAMNYGKDEDTPAMDDYYIPSNLLPVKNTDLPDFELPTIPADEPTEKRLVAGMLNMYTTIAEARQRCIEMGGTGEYHVHLHNGNTVFMPFETHEEYEAALANRLAEYYQDRELQESAEHQNDDEAEEYNEPIQKEESFDNYPQGATNNAKRMLEWREKYGRDVVKGGTEVGWRRASDLSERRPLSLSTVKRVHSFLSRHKDNAKIDPQYKDEPWKDRGYVAYNLWGGSAMVEWAKRISENE